jgi:broad-specificity NMP kinase
MKLIYIYGPPGVGKLTVATELAAATGFKLFHNHASISAVEPVFEFGSDSFFKLVSQIRIDVIEEAARVNLSGLIFTFVYANPSDDAFVDRVADAVEKHGGEVCFVQLFCDVQTLEERVLSESRKTHRKIATIETLREVMERYDIFSPVSRGDSLSIDNSQLTPQEVVRLIIAHYGLSNPISLVNH